MLHSCKSGTVGWFDYPYELSATGEIYCWRARYGRETPIFWRFHTRHREYSVVLAHRGHLDRLRGILSFPTGASGYP